MITLRLLDLLASNPFAAVRKAGARLDVADTTLVWI